MFEEQSRKSIGVLWIIVLLCCALPNVVLADDGDVGGGGVLVGTWRITLVPDPLKPQNQFPSLFVINEGNTMTERIGLHIISMVSGVWRKTRGNGNFALTSEGFVGTNSDGTFASRFQGRWTIHVEGDTLTGTFTVDTLNLDGTPVGGPPSVKGGRLKGVRMKVIPE